MRTSSSLHQALGLGDHAAAVEPAERAGRRARGRGTGSCRRAGARRARGPGRRPGCRSACEALGVRQIGGSRRRSGCRRAVGGCTPATILISVDLPAPLSPTSATISPASTSRLKSSIATTPPKVLWMPRSESAGGARRAHSGQSAARPNASWIASTTGAPRDRPGDADGIGARDESLRAEAEHDAVADARLGARRRSSIMP